MKKPVKEDFGYGDLIKWREEGGIEAYEIACKEYEDLSKRVIKSSQTYTFTIEKYEDGCRAMIRHNDGFTALELLGICSMISREIIDQQEGRIKPDIIKRNFIED